MNHPRLTSHGIETIIPANAVFTHVGRRRFVLREILAGRDVPKGYSLSEFNLDGNSFCKLIDFFGDETQMDSLLSKRPEEIIALYLDESKNNYVANAVLLDRCVKSGKEIPLGMGDIYLLR